MAFRRPGCPYAPHSIRFLCRVFYFRGAHIDTYIMDLVTAVLSGHHHRDLLLSREDVERVVRAIAEKRFAPNITTRRRHVQNVRDRVDNGRTKR